jgi:hypothetical protein
LCMVLECGPSTMIRAMVSMFTEMIALGLPILVDTHLVFLLLFKILEPSLLL